ncbi:MAG TPA: hypothetical protein DEQ34_05700 [Balneolaceae bacterium]|nr:hypothetical protein [Balneolaceae bacterium]|tara:strand:- start:41115 stop:41519 length:405 start_codon:yes stop_codon:yes gene_type:complete
MNLVPYLFFPGHCEEALEFYKKVFKGEITYLQRFGDASMPVDEDYRDKIMHATLDCGDFTIQFSDGPPHKEITNGDNIHLTVNFDDETKMRLVWGKLSNDGQVHMDLQDTFWGALYGQLEDKFGVRWMFNYEKK